jgi:hypothetical protein
MLGFVVQPARITMYPMYINYAPARYLGALFSQRIRQLVTWVQFLPAPASLSATFETQVRRQLLLRGVLRLWSRRAGRFRLPALQPVKLTRVSRYWFGGRFPRVPFRDFTLEAES